MHAAWDIQHVSGSRGDIWRALDIDAIDPFLEGLVERSYMHPDPKGGNASSTDQCGYKLERERL